MNKVRSLLVAVAAIGSAIVSSGAVDASVDLREYLEVGGHLIPTDIKPNASTEIEIDFETADTTHDKILFCVRNNGFAFLCWLGNKGGKIVCPGFGSTNSLGDKETGITPGERILVQLSAKGVLVNGKEVVSGSTMRGCDNGKTSTEILRILGMNSDTRTFYGKCYGCRVWQGGKLVRDFLPCVDGSGVPCMYDAVSEDYVRLESKNQADGVLAASSAKRPSSRVDFMAKGYVQDDLIAHWDAIENAGYGVHNAEATTWKNLVEGSAAGDLSLDKIDFYNWRDNFLLMKSGAAKSGKQLMTSGTVETGKKFTFEVMAYSNAGTVRRWEREPWNSSLESWATSGEGYLERIHSTRFAAISSLLIDQNLAFTTVYDGTTHSQYIRKADGTVSSKSAAATTADFSYAGKMAFLSDIPSGRGYSVRVYSRALTDKEMALNSALDQIRFNGKTVDTVVLPNDWKIDAKGNLLNASDEVILSSPAAVAVWTGAAGTADWSDAGNWADLAGAPLAAAPDGGEVRISGATVNVAADLSLVRLTLADGAVVNVAADKTLNVKYATQDGAAVAPGFMSEDSTLGWAADWVTGGGVVKVYNGETRLQTATYPAAALSDGWYAFGMASGYTLSEKKGFSGPADTGTKPFVKAENIDWRSYVFPPDAKVKLAGGVLMDTIPAGWFSTVDTTGLKQLTLKANKAFGDDSTLTVPSGCTVRYSPGTWTFHAASNGWYQTAVNSTAFLGNIVDDGTWYCTGNGTHYADQSFSGNFGGTGLLRLDNFSNHAQFYGDFNFTGNVEFGSDQGGSLRIFSRNVSGPIGKVTMHKCDGTYAANTQYCSTLLYFGPQSGAAAADDELVINELNSMATSNVTTDKGVHIRGGGVVVVWGGNTVRIKKQTSSVHFVGHAKDQQCQNNKTQDVATFGVGNVIEENLDSAVTLFMSTNVNLQVGAITSSPTFDYTYQANAVNNMKLEVTGSCATGAKVKATDLAMLPARLKGFAGTVTLTDTETKTYPVTLDVSKGTDVVYNNGGCDGSGTLGTAPAAGTINVTLTGTETPVCGKYGIARFTSVGDKLDGWTVTLNGGSETRVMLGSGEGAKVASLVRDTTGIWLKVSNPGFQLFVR